MGSNKQKPETVLSRAVESTGVAEVVRASSDKGSIKLLYRVRQKQIWLGILEYVLSRAEGWSAHVCQQYFMRGGKLIYGWNFILQPAKAVEVAAASIVEAGRVVPKILPVAGPLDSFPLVGTTSRRTAKIAFDPRLPGPDKGGPSHKGAYPMSSGE
jgi:hypothetical protein